MVRPKKIIRSVDIDIKVFTTVLFIIEDNLKPPGYLKKLFLRTLKILISD